MMDKCIGYTYEFIDNILIIMITFQIGFRHLRPKHGLEINLIDRTVTKIYRE